MVIVLTDLSKWQKRRQKGHQKGPRWGCENNFFFIFFYFFTFFHQAEKLQMLEKKKKKSKVTENFLFFLIREQDHC